MTFDTLDFSRRLKSAGFTEQQAETLAEATRERFEREIQGRYARAFRPAFGRHDTVPRIQADRDAAGESAA